MRYRLICKTCNSQVSDDGGWSCITCGWMHPYSTAWRLPSVKVYPDKTFLADETGRVYQFVARSSLMLEVKPRDSQAGDSVIRVCDMECPRELLLGRLREYPDRLNEHHLAILRKRYGLEDGVCHTVYETAAHFKLSRTRIDQIVQEDLKKLNLAERYWPFLSQL